MLPPIAPGSKKVLDKRRMAHKIAHASVQRIGRIKHIFAAASPCGGRAGEQWLGGKITCGQAGQTWSAPRGTSASRWRWRASGGCDSEDTV